MQTPVNKMPATALTTINEIMQAQLDALARIESILSNEHEALCSREPEQLLIAADAKAAALSHLGDLEEKRRSMSANLDSEQMLQLQELAARCRKMNLENASLLSTQQQHISRLLGLLRGEKSGKPHAYDAAGRTTGGAAQRLRLTQV